MSARMDIVDLEENPPPSDGGTGIWCSDGDLAAVIESVQVVLDRIHRALEGDYYWVTFTMMADLKEDEPERRPCWIRVTDIIGMTYISPEQVHKIENEL